MAAIESYAASNFREFLQTNGTCCSFGIHGCIEWPTPQHAAREPQKHFAPENDRTFARNVVPRDTLKWLRKIAVYFKENRSQTSPIFCPTKWIEGRFGAEKMYDFPWSPSMSILMKISSPTSSLSIVITVMLAYKSSSVPEKEEIVFHDMHYNACKLHRTMQRGTNTFCRLWNAIALQAGVYSNFNLLNTLFFAR